MTDVRMQISPTHFRVPDVLVLRADAPREPILTHPPLIAIEILSPEDRPSRFQDRIDDYVAFGVEHIWILDPAHRIARIAIGTSMQLVEGDELD
jgi:Uma2 family endonuclease